MYEILRLLYEMENHFFPNMFFLAFNEKNA